MSPKKISTYFVMLAKPVPNMNCIRLILLIAILFSHPVIAQDSNCTFKGIAIDVITHQPIRDLLIKVQPANLVTTSNSRGEFTIKGIAPGVYDLIFIDLRYQTLIMPDQKIDAGTTKIIFAELIKRKEPGAIFYIGGIEIVANKELLPEKIPTTTLIQSSDIEHIQAISLGDVLDLLPGAEIRTQPTLKDASRAMIRDPHDDSQFTSFGAKIIVDDIPISNNANLQDAGSVLSGVASSAGMGLDLREIPADNIESVEVIRGIAPAQYGDYVSAIVNVKTKTSSKPTCRLKAKDNPDIKELNLGGGFPLKDTWINYNINYAYSLKDIRKDYDNTHRLAAQVILDNRLLDNRLAMTNNFRFYKLYEEVNEDPSVPEAFATYNRGFRFIFGNKGVFNFNQTFKMHHRLYLNFRKVDSYRQKFVVVDNYVRSTLLEPGTMIGIKQYGGYIYRYYTKGRELTLGLDLDWIKKFFTGNVFHEFSWGSQLQFDNNYGKGRQFDILKPRKIGDRPRSFNSIPGMVIWSNYVNDQITGRFWRDFTLNLGVRFESYSSDNNGFFINPRINFAYYLTKNSQLRLGIGTSSKMPSLYFIYPPHEYVDKLDIVPVIQNSDTLFIQDSLITTYVYDRSNPNLKGYQETKWELSFDQRIGDFGISLTAFYSHRKDEPIYKYVPYLYYRYYRPHWPDSRGEQIAETYLDLYQIWINGGWSKFDGIELSLISKKIKYLNTNFSFQAAYYHSKHGASGMRSGVVNNLIVPYYKRHPDWNQKLVLTLQMNYISQPLGIWLSLTVHHVPHHISKRTGYADSLAIAYYDGATETMHYIPLAERMNEEYKAYHRISNPDFFKLWKYPHKWLFNVRVSKSLFEGAEISLYVNNLFDDRAFYKSFTNPNRIYPRNPEIFYGIECSMLLNDLL